MDFVKYFSAILNSIFTCSHANVPAAEGKVFCPDCGKGVVFRWVVLRCDGCGQRREGRYQFRQIVPSSPCCAGCGDTAVNRVVLPDPEFFQLRYALLSFESAENAEFWWQKMTLNIVNPAPAAAARVVNASFKPYQPVYQAAPIALLAR